MKNLTTLILALLVLGGCSESTFEEFTIFCEELHTDDYYSFKSDEVIYKSILNEFGHKWNSVAENDIIKYREDNKSFPIIEYSEGYIKFGNPPNEYAQITYVWNKATLSLRTTYSMFEDGKLAVIEVEGRTIDNPNTASKQCIKMQN